MYHNAPDGLAGNEDCGQMSAWYVMSALGFYPVTPAPINILLERLYLKRLLYILKMEKHSPSKQIQRQVVDC